MKQHRIIIQNYLYIYILWVKSCKKIKRNENNSKYFLGTMFSRCRGKVISSTQVVVSRWRVLAMFERSFSLILRIISKVLMFSDPEPLIWIFKQCFVGDGTTLIRPFCLDEAKLWCETVIVSSVLDRMRLILAS